MVRRHGSAERVAPLDLGLQWDVGAPLPHLLQSEHRTFLAFYLSDPPGWDGTFVEIVNPTSPSPEPLGVIEWLRCNGAVLGGPNDEAYHGHRLWSGGLAEVGAYRAAEVANSRWIMDLEKVNRVHPNHRPEAFSSLRHFILGFHDSTFECVAAGFRAYRATISMPEMLAVLATRVDDLGRDSDVPFEQVARG
jgi:hypothetical protein